MNTENLLLIGLLGVGAWLVFGGNNRTNNPTATAGTGAVYVPPMQAVPTYGGRPTPAAPGAMAWGLVPPQPTDAQQAAQVIGAIGSFVGNTLHGVADVVDSANG